MTRNEAIALRKGFRVYWPHDGGAVGIVRKEAAQFFEAVTVYWLDTREESCIHVNDMRDIRRHA